MNEPFERLILDCVGPLPKYILRLMCAATRLPEAVPLRSLRANIVVKEVIKFCSTFGLLKVIQTDQGSNFTSKLFAQVLKELGVSHQMSRAYHPESQGALERFHQTLKSMLRTYCVSMGKDWVEGLLLLLFAVRETVQESLGFSPSELVFGHTVCGPLKLLQEQLISRTPLTTNLLDYVSNFREQLHSACDIAKAHLVHTQSKMKSVKRNFQPGDQVLVLIPVPSSALHARFAGPYSIEKKLSETNYVISTPDRRRKSRVCHINMLKSYVGKTETEVVNYISELAPEHFQNSTVFSQLDDYLAYLPQYQKESLIRLFNKYPMLFSEVPGRTSMVYPL